MSALALASFLGVHLLALAVLAATAWAAGSLVTRTFSWEGRAERLAVPTALGLAVLAHLGFLLGALGLLRPGVLIAGIVVVHAAAFRDWRGALAGLRNVPGRWIALALIALAPAFVLALYPPTAFDETLYHLPFARAFARSGGLPAVPELRFPVFPALAELLFAETLLLAGNAGDMATHFVALVAVLATAGLLAAWGRKAFSPAAGWIAAALYLGNPIVAHLAGTDYVEPLLTLFITGALFAAWSFRQSGERGWLLLAAAFAGSAAGVKYLGLFFAAAVFVELAVSRRRLAAAFGFALAAFVVLAPTHARIAAHTGNPVFPFLPGLFGASDWDPIAIEDPGEIAASGNTLVRFLRLPWDVTFHRSAVGYQPPFSPYYLLGLPLLLAGAFRDARVRRLLVIPLVWGVVFLFLPPDSRYLVTVLPLVSLALAGLAGTVTLPKRFLPAVCLLAFLPGWLYAGYRIARQGPLPATAGERDVYLARKLPLYPAVRHLDRISSVAYAFHAENMKYFHGGTLYGDWIGPASYGRFLPLVGKPAALHRELRGLGASHLLLIKSGPAAVRPKSPDWPRWFRRVYEDPAAEVFVLAGSASDSRKSRR